MTSTQKTSSDSANKGTGGWGKEDKDSDQDGLSDGEEIRYMTDPLNPDTDGDGYLDGYEISKGRDPLDVADSPSSDLSLCADSPLDSDSDGLSDAIEDELGYDKNNPDTDGDGVPDGAEILNGTNPLTAETAGLADTDRDGISDNKEQEMGTNPNSADSDRDGLNDVEELLIYGTNTKNPDTNGDGILDGKRTCNLAQED